MSIDGVCKLSWNEDIANYFSDNIVTITGVYKYNPRFKIVIYIKII